MEPVKTTVKYTYKVPVTAVDEGRLHLGFGAVVHCDPKDIEHLLPNDLVTVTIEIPQPTKVS